MKVIAEIGSNWKSIYDALRSIGDAKRAGADIVKFQWFNNECLYGVSGSRSNLPPIAKLEFQAKRIGIELMCTAFSPEGYKLIDQHVQTHKIASSEITDIDILKTVASFKKPILLSTGGATIAQISDALEYLKGCDVTIMYCVTDYPARVVDFRMLDVFKEIYGPEYKYGYSDHSCDVLNIPVLARDRGAVILEKHVNFAGCTDTPDAPHSLSTEEFKLMIQHLKGKTSVVDTFHPNSHQRKLITLANGTDGYFRPCANAG